MKELIVKYTEDKSCHIFYTCIGHVMTNFLFLILDFFELTETRYSKKNTLKKIFFINYNFGKTIMLRMGQQKKTI